MLYRHFMSLQSRELEGFERSQNLALHGSFDLNDDFGGLAFGISERDEMSLFADE